MFCRLFTLVRNGAFTSYENQLITRLEVVMRFNDVFAWNKIETLDYLYIFLLFYRDANLFKCNCYKLEWQMVAISLQLMF